MTIDQTSQPSNRSQEGGGLHKSNSDRPPRSPNSIGKRANPDRGESAGAQTIWRSPNGIKPARISLIIPALNEEKLIGSILKLFGKDRRQKLFIELVVSDGGSSDKTVKIAKEYADVVVVHNEARRQTIAEGRNVGAARASGDLLVFINADTRPQQIDLFLKTLEEYHRLLDDEKRPIAWACPVRIAPEEQRLSDRLFHGFFNRYVRLLNLIGLGMGRGECQVVWRSDFEAVSGYENHMAAGEDFDLYRRLSARGAIGHGDGLRVYESPRRFRRFGYLRVLFEWTLNGLAVMVLGRSISKEWEQIR